MARTMRPSRFPRAGAGERSGVSLVLSSPPAPRGDCSGAGAAEDPGRALGDSAAWARHAQRASTKAVMHRRKPREITENSTLPEFDLKAHFDIFGGEHVRYRPAWLSGAIRTRAASVRLHPDCRTPSWTRR